jgi:hypothetical protein
MEERPDDVIAPVERHRDVPDAAVAARVTGAAAAGRTDRQESTSRRQAGSHLDVLDGPMPAGGAKMLLW